MNSKNMKNSECIFKLWIKHLSSDIIDVFKNLTEKKIIFFALILIVMYFAGAVAGKIASVLPMSADVYRTYNKITNKNDNWGLGFSGDNKPPTGNVSADELKKYNAYYIGDTSKNDIYLTFDCGYDNGNATKILDVLKKHDVKATFFVVGCILETSPDIIKRMADEGHTVGNHTYHHRDMSQISSLETFQSEIGQIEEKYKQITGNDMVKYYRPPQGKYNIENLKMAKQLGYNTFFWSLAYVDWYDDKQPSKEEAMSKLCKRIHPGAIVLLHSTSSTNAQILDELLDKWNEMGYTVHPLSDILT